MTVVAVDKEDVALFFLQSVVCQRDQLDRLAAALVAENYLNHLKCPPLYGCVFIIHHILAFCNGENAAAI